MNENNKLMFEKCVFNSCKSLINEIFSSERTFRSNLPQVFENYDSFVSSLFTKDHLTVFTYFLAILCFTKKNHVKNKEHFIELFKEKTLVSDHAVIDKRNCSLSSNSCENDCKKYNNISYMYCNEGNC